MLDATPYQEALQQLAYHWLAARRPADGLSYADSMEILRTMLLTIQRPERTAAIVTVVPKQAVHM
ncbi:hypothetical protein [Fibrivirga algicola]|uniref:Uncharacterized protein n=1 Tax=Fibrivirga algicola TaxID=2950420 RepID=A0ABX0QM35_9BACT|nr:hypothetical protein [Fibrivirga algicola]NID13520.1 hypothetical protein [Fibrivirga algicola]